MKTLRLLPLALLLSVPGVFASDETVKENEVYSSTVEATAKVKDINYKTREVTLEDQEGNTFKTVADQSIRNLDQVKKGDTVVAAYAESLVYSIDKEKGAKAKAPEVTEAQWSARPGSNPNGGAARQVNASLIVNKIDKNKPSVTLKNSNGELRTFKVRHPERLENLKVGDKVDVTYTEAVALKLEKKGSQKN